MLGLAQAITVRPPRPERKPDQRPALPARMAYHPQRLRRPARLRPDRPYCRLERKVEAKQGPALTVQARHNQNGADEHGRRRHPSAPVNTLAKHHARDGHAEDDSSQMQGRRRRERQEPE